MSLTNTATASTGTSRRAPASPDVLVHVDNFKLPPGWSSPVDGPMLSRQCCEHLEDGRILYFDGIPFNFPEEDREFLLSQRQSGSRLHKNVSFRPRQDKLRGAAGDAAEVARLQAAM